MNSMSIMPPRSCLRSNRSLSFGWPSRSRSRIASTSLRSFASSRGTRRMARRSSSNEAPASAFGAQAQVDVEENARRSTAGEPAAQALRQPRVGLLRALVGIVVEKDEVEIGRVAQLLAAELSVRDDREARRVAMARAQLRPAQLQRDLQHGVGEIGQ